MRAAAFLLFLAVLMSSAGRIEARASVSWPYPGGDIQAEGAVVMDADTKTVLWGINQDVQYCPASITKMMTAIVVAESCQMNEKVPVTANAVYGLESGATTAGLSVDDILSVEDLLNALLLKSANDAANALAIYVGGSISGFADMMNKKAEELGCKHTQFQNPSGLTDDDHLTTPYDMALIAAEFVKNDSLLEIESHDRYKLSPTKKYPSGLTVIMGHKMLRSNTSYSDDRVIAGKTGFISASGNTLVTVAEQDGRRVIVVCMKDKNPYHYTDTRTLLDFGFSSFKNVEIAEPTERFQCAKRLVTDKIADEQGSNIVAADKLILTLPSGADDSDVTVSYDYNIPSYAPDMAVARMKVYYDEYNVGNVWLLNDRESSLVIESVADAPAAVKAVGITAILIAAAALLVILFTGSRVHVAKRERERKQRFREKQRKRLAAMGVSEDEFDDILKRHGVKRRNSADSDSAAWSDAADTLQTLDIDNIPSSAGRVRPAHSGSHERNVQTAAQPMRRKTGAAPSRARRSHVRLERNKKQDI